MNFITKILPLLALIMVVGCKSPKQEAVSDIILPTEVAEIPRPVKKQMALPHAVLYKTNGDYNQNVMITLNAQHNDVISYPDPTDVGTRSIPIEIGDGWLLDRRGGIGLNSVFLSYTYDEYAKLPHAPSKQELMANIIPGAHVTALRELPITVNEALADPTALKKYIAK